MNSSNDTPLNATAWTAPGSGSTILQCYQRILRDGPDENHELLHHLLDLQKNRREGWLAKTNIVFLHQLGQRPLTRDDLKRLAECVVGP